SAKELRPDDNDDVAQASARTRPAGAGSHRDGAGAQRRAGAGNAPAAQGPGGEVVARRLRYGFLQPQLSETTPGRQGEDRSFLRPRSEERRVGKLRSSRLPPYQQDN